jgi:signal transduction histidine kinase
VTAPHDTVAGFRRRLGERDFWLVQTGVVGVTVAHAVLEVWQFGGPGAELYEGVRHLPVVAYAVPVAFASLRYGTEGGYLTASLITLLSLPNIAFTHREGFGWLGELLTVVAIVALGVILSTAGEREQRSRARAEAVSQRLTLLADLASGLSRLPDAGSFLITVLEEMVDALGIQAAGVVGLGHASPNLSVGERSADLEQAASRILAGVEPSSLAPDVLAVTIGARTSGAYLLVMPSDAAKPSDRDLSLLETAAEEIGIAVENARLQHRERDLRLRYLQSMTEAQEEERRRIAREIHDEAQTLVTLSRGLERLADDLVEQGSAVLEFRDLALEGIEGLRRLSRDLRPPALDDLGLVPALEWLLSRVSQHGTMSVAVSVEGHRRRVAGDIELAAFRIAQESIGNAQKHADASRLQIIAEYRSAQLKITIEDDGNGFDPDAAQEPPGLGIVGMLERARAVGGRLDISSRPGRGTRVSATFAIGEEDSNTA